MVKKEEIITFLKKYKWWFIGVLIVIFIAGLIPLFINNNPFIRDNEKATKVLLDSLHKENKLLIKQLQINKDSIQILHEAALVSIARDTIYVNQIKWLKDKTNEEVQSVYNNSVDSNLRLHTKLSEEFIRGLSGKDSL